MNDIVWWRMRATLTYGCKNKYLDYRKKCYWFRKIEASDSPGRFRSSPFSYIWWSFQYQAWIPTLRESYNQLCNNWLPLHMSATKTLTGIYSLLWFIDVTIGWNYLLLFSIGISKTPLGSARTSLKGSDFQLYLAQFFQIWCLK